MRPRPGRPARSSAWSPTPPRTHPRHRPHRGRPCPPQRTTLPPPRPAPPASPGPASGSSVAGLLQPLDGGGVVFGEQGGGVGAAPVRLDTGAEQAAAGLHFGLAGPQLVGGGRLAP